MSYLSDIVSAANDQDAVAMAAAVNNVMAQKVSAILDQNRREHAARVFADQQTDIDAPIEVSPPAGVTTQDEIVP